MKTIKTLKKAALLTMISVFLSNVGYSQTQKGLNITGGAAGDRFGSTVSISSDGNIIAIGAKECDDGGTNAGQVKVYEWSGSAWSQKGAYIDGEAADDLFGYSVSLSADGTTFIAGAPQNDGTGNNAGHARVFNWNGSSWVQLGIDLDGEAAFDQSGRSVAISDDGSTVIIGAIYNEGTGVTAGHGRVYSWDGTNWVQKGMDIDAANASEQCGYSVSINNDGSIVAISSPENDDNGSFSGHVRIFAWSGTSWVQRGGDINGEAVDDLAGYSISLDSSGNTIAIGSHRNSALSTDGGSVRIFEWSGSAWTQKGVDMDGSGSYANWGLSVSLSDDGNTFAAGSPFFSYGMFSFEGYAKVFTWSGSAWTQIGTEIAGANESDNMGRSVQISGDGTTLITGAPENDDNGDESGLVGAYTFSPVSNISKEINAFEALNLYPNPSGGNMEIDLGKNHRHVQVTVTNESGQQVKEFGANNTHMIHLNLQNEAAGAYFIRLKSDEEITVMKVLKH